MSGATLGSYVRLARPRDWIKNVFVLMPLPFSLAAGGVLDVPRFLAGLIGFCLTSSAVYAFNDSVDAAADGRHPEKRRRPVASGAISPAAARVFALALLAAGIALVAASGSARALQLALTYVALDLVYALWARRVPLVDVVLLSSFYVIRVLLGCALVQVVASQWLLLCSSSLALFLALSKRYGDLVAGVDEEHRPSLSGYTRGFLDRGMVITSAMSIVAYALYCMEAPVLQPGRELATLPFVVFGVLEFLRLVHVRTTPGNPVDLVFASPALWATGAGWIGAALWSVRSG